MVGVNLFGALWTGIAPRYYHGWLVSFVVRLVSWFIGVCCDWAILLVWFLVHPHRLRSFGCWCDVCVFAASVQPNRSDRICKSYLASVLCVRAYSVKCLCLIPLSLGNLWIWSVVLLCVVRDAWRRSSMRFLGNWWNGSHVSLCGCVWFILFESNACWGTFAKFEFSNTAELSLTESMHVYMCLFD